MRLSREASPLLRLFGTRHASVLAWGRNSRGECGLRDWHPVVLAPRPVHGLQDVEVAALAAGKAHSAAVLASGNAFTWGEGSDGKLGHGCADNAHVPARVEALAERVRLTGAAAGRHHTLLLDDQGGAWACGDGRSGQLGLGAPLQQLARQAQSNWGGLGGLRPALVPSASSGSGGAAAASAQGAGGSAAAAGQQQIEYTANHSWSAMHLHPLVDHLSRTAELGHALSLYDGQLRSVMSRRSAWAAYESARTAGGAAAALGGIGPLSSATPARVGGGRHALLSMQLAEVRNLADERIVQVDASWHSSIALTAAGEVWTFGGAEGGLMPPAPRPVAGALAQLLAAHGGATRVAVGGSFCTALCADGSAVVWGVAASGAAGGALAAAAEAIELPHLSVSRADGLLIALVTDLPPMRHVAAGAGHVLLSDGERVWALGRSAGAPLPSHDPAATDDAVGDAVWLTPRELLHLPGRQITALRVGGFASAVVDDSGSLWLWGRLLGQEAAAGMLQAAEASGYGHWAAGSSSDGEVSSWTSWAGLGAEAPTLVPGLSGVRDICLGTQHALALVD